ncbi:MAG TPA: ABC transporter permease [Solirubrobacteraceae bacterium]|nr:ABC transporter permease [Solirubrobacteraceae bacterium]
MSVFPRAESELVLEATEAAELPTGAGPYKLAWRRLRRNRVALAFGVLFVVILVLCLLAPIYSHDIAHIGPDATPYTFTIGHKTEFVISATGVPIGPTWHLGAFFLGADGNNRDVAVRLLYGGRNSLEIGAVATLITMLLATICGLLAGYFRGLTDGIISRTLDVIWAYPAVLLGIVLGTVLAVHGIGPLHSTTLLSTAFVIGIVYIPYVAKPIRAQVLALREREFVDAARQQGLSHVRIMASEILPNLASTIIVFIPLMMANAILTEAGLTYLGAGVRPPNPSWGTMISDGINAIPAAFHNVLIPGIMLVLAVLSINVFGDGLRDALDPRAKIRIGKE